MEGRRAPGGPPRHETKPLSLDSGVLTLSWQPASPCSSGRYGRVEGCWTSPANIPTRVNTLGHQEQRHAEPERRPMHLSNFAPRLRPARRTGLLPMEAGCPQDARAREASRDELQADGTGWVRAIWVAARQGSGGGCLILLLHGPPATFAAVPRIVGSRR